MTMDSARFVKRFAALAFVLAVSACGGLEWPAKGGGPTAANRPGEDLFVNATAVRVGKGDTVYSIARRHKLSPRDIIDANGLRPPYELSVGQRLVLPGGRLHTVQKGEYLALIARKYDADTFTIARLNAIRSPYTIYPGQQLRIPRSDAPQGGAETVRETAATWTPPKDAPPQTEATPTPTRTRTASNTAAKAPVSEPPNRSGGKFQWPVKGKILSGFGSKAKGLQNDGINIEAPRGSQVRAAENGVVAYAGNEIRGFGNLLLIKHSGGWVTAYAHNEDLLVKRGDTVKKGQSVATVGSSGSVASPQLHFELRKGKTAVDPEKYMM
ncbi:MAG: M23 family metallopeptidase [Alphaproteobacteria bacterium]|nr:M23 family metallopeptidase [Alphaproteobacteria bacterium]MBF0251211.1 M23 family metallopeptidase [Alphaproteobacteria bacterium]